MCYKEELQFKNEQKLQEIFQKDNVPMFLQRCIKRSRSSNSMACCIRYWGAVKDLLLWLMERDVIHRQSISEIAPEDFKSIKAQDVSDYLQYKEDNGMSPTTTETRKNIFQGFWNRLVAEEVCDKNVIQSVDYKGISTNNNLIKKLPTESQLEHMENKINKAHDTFLRTRNMAIFKTLMGTGIRVSELVGLDLSDLFLKENMPYIMVIRKRKYRKQESSVVFLTKTAVNAIEEWLLIRNSFENVGNNQAVFITKKGKRLTEQEIRSLFTNKSDGLTPHMLRHWYATIMAQNAGIVFTQQQLGHSSQSTTINNYANGSYGMQDILENM